MKSKLTWHMLQCQRSSLSNKRVPQDNRSSSTSNGAAPHSNDISRNSTCSSISKATENITLFTISLLWLVKCRISWENSRMPHGKNKFCQRSSVMSSWHSVLFCFLLYQTLDLEEKLTEKNKLRTSVSECYATLTPSCAHKHRSFAEDDLSAGHSSNVSSKSSPTLISRAGRIYK